MKILLANKFFYDHGGPESVLFAERDLLIGAGHQVVDFAMRDPRNRDSAYAEYFSPNIDLQSVRPTRGSLRDAIRFLDSREAASCVRALVRQERPDVAHLHSINHQLTPSIIRALHSEGVPIVMTLHDYKLVCPAYTLLADGRICESCTGGRFYRATTSRCRGTARSALLAAESYLQHRLLRSYRHVALFLSPSRFLAGKFHEMGFRYPIEVVPNPSRAAIQPVARNGKRDAFVFVGRVVPEKGLRTLCAATVTAEMPLKIVGDGPQLAELRSEFADAVNIEFAGRMSPEQAQQAMAEALAVVVPSEWYENQSMVILEAFARTTPVIASDLGGNPELVQPDVTGLLHRAGDVADLAAKLTWAMQHADEMQSMGERAREFAKDLSPDVHLERLLDVFERVMVARKSAGRRYVQS